jgi:hypothetical protein
LTTVEINGLKDAAAAGVGYATGGTAGAIAGGTAQIIKNHAPVTAAKNPSKVTP